MSILVDHGSRVLVQGITGKNGRFHTRQMLAYGTRVVAGVKPGTRGEEVDGVPVFPTVADAVQETGANVAILFVPGPWAAEAICEAADAGIPLVVAITEGIPVLDMVRVMRFLEGRPTRLVGPNCPGLITPGQCKVGLMPGHVHRPGRVGVVSRSGTLTYEAVAQLSGLGIGQSTCLGIGGDPIIGTTFIDALALFEQDTDTDAVVLIGEIGGTAEEQAARFVRERMTKPVAAYIAGISAPPGKRMGHAGAIIEGGKGTAKEKIAALEAAGIRVARVPSAIGETLAAVL
ncbi:MAG: succinate--CoA ligase subunit alpha [Deltaproteobacteria bacterium]|nr:succinate--CoA ligase subunit alpha [Deltaproteobacteria bacterium]